ncbi:MAG TPA: hypothetical protein PLK17_10315 [Bacteroidales bacterium]|jgi:hypothetical protein|nr:hypothetical protein [Bacteroidales bacterium]HPJ05898.1 hypothetical protein [Bacteroidales bacterium]HPQ64706.1 hypothetical protein [Bacteroidales bacterium]HRW27831.1 hypothetical protein [Bacteroidales bacterium]
MEQKDYLLREIEKIGDIIRAIRQKLFGGTDDLAISVANQAEALKEMMLSEAFIDLDEIFVMDATETDAYLAGQKGFNVENIELLAQTLADIGMTSAPPASFAMLEKALQLYEICNLRDRTYSFAREAQINRIREELQTGM